MNKKILIIVDPQNDFIEGGSLAVPGAKEAMNNLVRHLKIESSKYQEIYVSLDTHNSTNLGFKENWEGPGIDKVFPGQPFPTDLIKSGEIWPKFKYTRAMDIETVLKQPNFMCWPPHCIKGTPGNEIYPPLQEILKDLKDKVTYLIKGGDDARDNYSIFHYGDGNLTDLGKFWYLEHSTFSQTPLLPNDNSLDIYVAGLALDYCVFETIKSLQKLSISVKDYILLSSMGASIQDKRTVSKLYDSLERKITIV